MVGSFENSLMRAATGPAIALMVQTSADERETLT